MPQGRALEASARLVGLVEGCSLMPRSVMFSATCSRHSSSKLHARAARNSCQAPALQIRTCSCSNQTTRPARQAVRVLPSTLARPSAMAHVLQIHHNSAGPASLPSAPHVPQHTNNALLGTLGAQPAG